MAITEVLPNRGSEGTDVEIHGNGFANAIGVQFGGVAAAMLVISDILIRATVPPDAVAGKVTVIDPDGDQLSPFDFDVVVSALPQNTTRGRAALDVITLLMAAFVRRDYDGVSRWFLPIFWLRKSSTEFIASITKPTSTAIVAVVEDYNQLLLESVPEGDFILLRMQLINDAVLINFTAADGFGATNQYLVALRNSSAGYRVALLEKAEV